MAIPYTQTTMANVRAVDGTFISYPFLEDGDTSTKVYNMICTQRESDYNAAQIDLDDPMTNATTAGVIELPFTGDSSAYFVGDTGHSSIGGGMIQFTRTFSNIPQTITTASGSAFVTFPGISRTSSSNSFADMSSISMTSGTRGISITTSSVHGLLADDYATVTMSYTVDSDPFIHSINGTFRVISAASTTVFSIDVGHYWQSQVSLLLISGTMYENGLSTRSPISRNVSTLTRYDYILPGVSAGISDVLDVVVPPAFVVTLDYNGNVTQTLGIGSPSNDYPATTPSPTEYIDMVKDEQNIIVESSLAEWAGNILVMTTKTCKAQ